MTKIINGEVIKTLNFKFDVSISAPESEIPALFEEVFGDTQPHTYQELGDKLKEIIENEAMEPAAKAIGGSIVVHKSEVTELP